MKTFFKILTVFIVWRLALCLISATADNFLLYSPSFPYADAILETYDLPRRIYSWANFDGVHYITIVEKGYLSTGLIQAFFPIYPILTRFLNYFVNNAIISGLFISNIAFVLFLFVWYKFISEEFSKKIAKFSTLSLLLFPTSFFFVAYYTESLFMLFVIGAFWATRKKKYWLSAVCIALASATRITGIFLIPALILEIVWPKLQLSAKKINWEKLKVTTLNKFKTIKKFYRPVGIISLGSFGLFAYMAYLQKYFSDPLYFFHVQSEFGGGVRQENLISYPQVLYRYIKILLTVKPFDLKYFSYIQDFIVGTFGLAVILYSVTKTRLSYVVFSLLAFILPTLTGTFSSMPRYILISFSLFIVLGLWSEKSRLFKFAWFTISTIILILNTVLFIQGYWVA